MTLPSEDFSHDRTTFGTFLDVMHTALHHGAFFETARLAASFGTVAMTLSAIFLQSPIPSNRTGVIVETILWLNALGFSNDVARKLYNIQIPLMTELFVIVEQYLDKHVDNEERYLRRKEDMPAEEYASWALVTSEPAWNQLLHDIIHDAAEFVYSGTTGDREYFKRHAWSIVRQNRRRDQIPHYTLGSLTLTNVNDIPNGSSVRFNLNALSDTSASSQPDAIGENSIAHNVPHDPRSGHYIARREEPNFAVGRGPFNVEFMPNDSLVELVPTGPPVPRSAFCLPYRALPEQCGVCQSEITQVDAQAEVGKVVSAWCGHLFHGDCLDEWVNSSAMSGANRCPICRKRLCKARQRQ